MNRGYVIHGDGTATCSRCGAMVKAGPKEDWTNVHDSWHEQGTR